MKAYNNNNSSYIEIEQFKQTSSPFWELYRQKPEQRRPTNLTKAKHRIIVSQLAIRQNVFQIT